MFNSLSISNSIELVNYFKNKIKVVDMGCQTFDPKNNNLEKILSHKLATEKQKLAVENLFKEKKIISKISVEDFFIALGCERYNSVDINGDWGSFSYDLNYNLIDEYNFNEKYDLVINNGTSEHLFNQYSFFKNAHELCKEDGLMIHVLPFIGYVNHGFFNYPPLFFIDLAAANEYEITKISFCNRDGAELIVDKERYINICTQIRQKAIYKKSFLSEIINISKNKIGEDFFILAVLKKINNEDFIIPLQGKYLSDIKTTEHSNKYITKKKGSEHAGGQNPDKDKRKDLNN